MGCSEEGLNLFSSQLDPVHRLKKESFHFSRPHGYESLIYLSFKKWEGRWKLLLKEASFSLTGWNIKSAVIILIALEDFKVIGASFNLNCLRKPISDMNPELKMKTKVCSCCYD